MINVCVTAPFMEQFRKQLIDEFKDTYQFNFTDKKDIEAMKASDILVGMPLVSQLQQLPDLKLLLATSAGFDRYSENPETPKSFPIAHVEGVFGVTISEFVVGGILALYRNFYSYHDMQKNHDWHDLGADDTICGKSVVILGTGDIGGNVAKRLSVFDCHITGLNRSGKKVEFFDETDTLDNIDNYLPDTDLLICCLPANKATIDFLTYDRMKLLKKNAVIVNIGRGKLFAEGALEKLTLEDHLRAVITDVVREEPLPKDSVLWDRAQMIITPHISGIGFGHNKLTEEKIYNCVRDNLINYRDGKPLQYLIHLD